MLSFMNQNLSSHVSWERNSISYWDKHYYDQLGLLRPLISLMNDYRFTLCFEVVSAQPINSWERAALILAVNVIVYIYD